MLRRTLAAFAVLTLVMTTATPANADPDDSSGEWIEDSGNAVDFGIERSGGDARPAASKTKSSGERDVWTLSERVDAVCTTTTGMALDPVPGLSTPVCLTLNSRGGAVDAAALAQNVRDSLNLATPEIHTSPEAPVKALVGLETWMWVPASQWTALTESATVGGTTVTVRAEPISTRWDMGEAVKFCPNPGRVWREGLGQDAATPCGYTYRHTSLSQPENKYQISGQIRYYITWTCTGDCSAPSGDLGTLDSTATTASLEVGERHSVVIS